MGEYQEPKTYTRQQRYWMDRAQVKKAVARPSLLEVRLMEDRELWDAALRRAMALREHLADGRDATMFNAADQLVDIVIELQARGTQLELFPEGI